MKAVILMRTTSLRRRVAQIYSQDLKNVRSAVCLCTVGLLNELLRSIKEVDATLVRPQLKTQPQQASPPFTPGTNQHKDALHGGNWFGLVGSQMDGTVHVFQLTEIAGL